MAVDYFHPETIVLFGSRSRDTARKNSDYDLAFKFSEEMYGKWVNFVVDIEDQPVTLLPVDLIDFHKAPMELKKRIQSEGIVLYDKNRAIREF